MPKPTRDIADLLTIMARLRDKETGCPWDIQQDFASIAPYTLEEAYEVLDAIERHDMVDLKDELGDLLLQVVFHAQIASEAQSFNFADVVEGLQAKLIRRHPHVFGDEVARSSGMVKGIWERIKAEERALKAIQKGQLPHPALPAKTANESLNEHSAHTSLLADVPLNMPGLTRAMKLQEKAAKVGFDWDELSMVLAKVREELDEVEAEIKAAQQDHVKITDEIGDLLASVSNLARHLKVDPEAALRRSNAKFTRRFAYIERALADAGEDIQAATLDRMDALWNEAKQHERHS